MELTINLGAIWAALGAIAGATTAASVIWLRVIKPARGLLGWIGEFREDWAGVPDRPGVPGRPGMMVRMASLESEFRPNGGNSMRDRVDVIERRQLNHEGAHAAAHAAVATVVAASPILGESGPNGSEGKVAA